MIINKQTKTYKSNFDKHLFLKIYSRNRMKKKIVKENDK